MKILEKAFEKHKVWLNITKSFGLDESTAEDIVQEMYIKLHKITEKGTNIIYKQEGKEDELNYYYIWKILFTMFLQLKKKKSKVFFVQYGDSLQNIEGSEEVQFKEMEDRFNKEFGKLHWYDQRVFEIIASGTKISELSRKSTITYISLYNTYTKVKKLLKNKIGL